MIIYARTASHLARNASVTVGSDSCLKHAVDELHEITPAQTVNSADHDDTDSDIRKQHSRMHPGGSEYKRICSLAVTFLCPLIQSWASATLTTARILDNNRPGSISVNVTLAVENLTTYLANLSMEEGRLDNLTEATVATTVEVYS